MRSPRERSDPDRIAEQKGRTLTASPPKPAGTTVSTAAKAAALLGESRIEAAPSVAPNAEAAGNPLDAFRISTGDHRRALAWERAWAEQRRTAGSAGLSALALSCGGANGAFGAGVMVGWSRSGRRPDFDVVTGVSTGALIAPFVFAGPAWDARLRAAYLDGRLRAFGDPGWLARMRCGLGALFRSSLAGATPLIRLIREYADDRLLRAIAAAHDAGRRLLVTTTNLQSQECVVWDLGAIAKASTRPDDGGRSVRLFHSVLIACASVPGLFPPTPISWDPDGRHGEELHVDGCVNAPFFLAPGSMRRAQRGEPRELHVVINGSLDPRSGRVRRGVIPILLRALDTMGRANVRARIAALELLAERHGVTFSCTAIPDDRPADPFDFTTDNLESLFAFGQAAALGALRAA